MSEQLQVVVDCPDHEECTAIYLPAARGAPSFEFAGEAVAWATHAHSDIHPEHRLNLDSPEARDRRGRHAKQPATLRWSPICAECAAHPASPWHDEAGVEAVHAEAAEKGLLGT